MCVGGGDWVGGWVGYARVYARVLMHPCFERYICVCGCISVE